MHDSLVSVTVGIAMLILRYVNDPAGSSARTFGRYLVYGKRFAFKISDNLAFGAGDVNISCGSGGSAVHRESTGRPVGELNQDGLMIDNF